jgi:predicted acetyltransferase
MGGHIVLVDRERAARDFTSVLDQVRPRQPGVLRLPDYWLPLALKDFEPWRHGGSEQYLAVYEDDQGLPAGFAWYRTKLEWSDNQPDGTLTLEQLVAATSEAYRALWRYCLRVDLMARVKARMRPVDEPLRLLLTDARAPKVQVFDSLWLRLVDVRSALAGRQPGQSGALTIEVQDAICPWNQGRFRLEASDREVSCEPASGAADLVMDVAELGAVYLGGNSAFSLQAAGRIEEKTPRSVDRLQRMFQGERAPWCPTHF